MNTQTKPFANTLQALAGALLLIGFTACDRSMSSATSPPKTSKGNLLNVMSNLELPPPGLSVEEVSCVAPHRCVLTIAKPQIGKPIKVTFSLQDAQNRQVFLLEPDVTGTPDVAPCYFSQDFTPDPTKQKPGRWKWTAAIQDGPTLTKEFSVLPPTAREAEDLNLHEKACHTALIVFANFWRSRGDALYGFEKIDGAEHVLRELRGVRWIVRPKPLSSVDIANGISFKGEFTLGYKMFRTYVFSKGWHEWESGFDTAFIGRYSELVLDQLPVDLIAARSYQMHIQCISGHWHVTSSFDLGGVFGIEFVDEIAFKQIDPLGWHRAEVDPTAVGEVAVLPGLPPDDLLDQVLAQPSSAMNEEIKYTGNTLPAPKLDQMRIETVRALRGGYNYGQ